VLCGSLSQATKQASIHFCNVISHGEKTGKVATESVHNVTAASRLESVSFIRLQNLVYLRFYAIVFTFAEQPSLTLWISVKINSLTNTTHILIFKARSSHKWNGSFFLLFVNLRWCLFKIIFVVISHCPIVGSLPYHSPCLYLPTSVSVFLTFTIWTPSLEYASQLHYLKAVFLLV